MLDVKKQLLRPITANKAADLLQANLTAAQALAEDRNPKCNALCVSTQAETLLDSNRVLIEAE
jgi:hypothetical protein